MKIIPTKKLFLTQTYEPKKMYVKHIEYSERLIGSMVDVHLLHTDGRDTGTYWTYLYADCPEHIREQIKLAKVKK